MTIVEPFQIFIDLRVGVLACLKPTHIDQFGFECHGAINAGP